MRIKIQEDGTLLEQDQEMLEEYFSKVVNLSDSNKEDEFVVDIDDVWSLGYRRRQECVRALSKNFMEGIDYRIVEEKKDAAGRPFQRTMITLKCMEFLIARRVRPVFEIYRKIFHAVVDGTREFRRQEGLSEELKRFINSQRNDRVRTEEETEKEYLLSLFAPAFALINYLDDRFTRNSPADHNALIASAATLGRWRGWIENHDIRTYSRLHVPYSFDSSWFNVLRCLTHFAEVPEVKTKWHLESE